MKRFIEYSIIAIVDMALMTLALMPLWLAIDYMWR